MAKGKKGKQKQEATAPAQEATITGLAEDPPKVHDDGGGMMEMEIGHGSYPAQHSPARAQAGAIPTVWPLSSPATGWGASANPQSTKATNNEQKSSTASKTVGWASGLGDGDTGWGGGAADGWGARSPDNGKEEVWEEEDDEEWEEESEDRWGSSTNAGAWGIQPNTSQPAQPGWKSWNEEAKRLSKVPSMAAAAPAANSNKPVLSHQQQSQILKSLLTQSTSSQNGYLAAAQQQQKLRQQQPALNPYYQKPVPQPTQTAGAFASATPSPWQSLGKQDKKSQKETSKHQHQRSQSESRDQWGTDSGGWGAASTGGWGRESSAWGSDAGDRGQEAGGWGKDSGGWGTNSGGRGKDSGGWGTDRGWGPIPEEDEGQDEEYEEYEDYEEDERRVHFTPKSSKGGSGWGSEPLDFDPSLKGSESSKSIAKLWAPGRQKDTSYTMPSKTLAHAYNGTTTSLNTGLPRNKINEYTNVQFHDSQGAAMIPAQQALFGRARKAKDRIHWMFPPNKDERVKSLLTWIETVSRDLGTYGLHRFLQSRERGALIANADYQIPGGKNEPAFDWLTFGQLQETRDKIMQESAAFYDPAVQAIVFVFLPSKSGNSVAMWRRKINVPNNMRLMLQGEISLAMAALRRDEDYIVHVDEYPQPQPSPMQKQSGSSHRRLRRSSLPSRTEYADAYPMIIEETGKLKKKRKWWQFFRVDW